MRKMMVRSVKVCLCVALLLCFMPGAYGSHPTVVPGYTDSSFPGVLNALRDGLDGKNEELIRNALYALRGNRYEVQAGGAVLSLFQEWKKLIASPEYSKTYSQDLESDSTFLIDRTLWITCVVMYENIPRDIWCEYLEVLKSTACLRGNRGMASELVILKVARTRIPLDVFPCCIAGAIRSQEFWGENWKEWFCAFLFDVYADRITKDMLIAMARAHGDSASFRASIDKLGQAKYGCTFDQLKAMSVDVNALYRSLNIEQWPQNVMPEKPALLQPSRELNRWEAYAWEHGYTLDMEGYTAMLDAGVESDNEEMMVNAIKCMSNHETLGMREYITPVFAKFRDRYRLATLENPELALVWGALVSRFTSPGAEARPEYEGDFMDIWARETVISADYFPPSSSSLERRLRALLSRSTITDRSPNGNNHLWRLEAFYRWVSDPPTCTLPTLQQNDNISVLITVSGKGSVDSLDNRTGSSPKESELRWFSRHSVFELLYGDGELSHYFPGTISMAATPAEGWVFAGWTVNGIHGYSTNPILLLAADQVREIYAVFLPGEVGVPNDIFADYAVFLRLIGALKPGEDVDVYSSPYDRGGSIWNPTSETFSVGPDGLPDIAQFAILKYCLDRAGFQSAREPLPRSIHIATTYLENRKHIAADLTNLNHYTATEKESLINILAGYSTFSYESLWGPDTDPEMMAMGISFNDSEVHENTEPICIIPSFEYDSLAFNWTDPDSDINDDGVTIQEEWNSSGGESGVDRLRNFLARATETDKPPTKDMESATLPPSETRESKEDYPMAPRLP